MLPLCLALAALVALAGGQEFDLQAFCDAACTNSNGGFYPHPDDCCSYITCSLVVRPFRPDKVRADVTACKSPLVWNPSAAACDYHYNVPGCDSSCHPVVPTVPQVNVTEPTTGDNECARDGIVYGVAINESTGEPVDLSCFHIVDANPDNDDSLDNLICCQAKDFEFSLVDCCCEGPENPPECDCIMCIAFELGEIRDVVHDAYIEFNGVTIESPGNSPGQNVGCFDGNGSLIRISEFANFYYSDVFSINFFFSLPMKFLSANNEVNVPKMGLFSNGCCNESGSIEIWLDGQGLFLNFKTEDGEVMEKNLIPDGRSLVVDDLIDVTIRYCSGKLRLNYGGSSVAEEIILGGNILRTPCALTLGQLNDDEETGFEGCMENISVCRDCWTDNQVIAAQNFDEASIMCRFIPSFEAGLIAGP